MNSDTEFADYAARWRALITDSQKGHAGFAREAAELIFSELARELFALQFRHNSVLQKFCRARGATPANVVDWREIPCVPTAAFKDFEVTCWPAAERSTVFHSSGTTTQTPSRHFHNTLSLSLYEASLLPWFAKHLLPAGAQDENALASARKHRFLMLAPPIACAPRSSLVHMFDTVRREFGSSDSVFVGEIGSDGSWSLKESEAVAQLQRVCAAQEPLIVLGTAFSLVHLLDFLAHQNLRFELPAGSRVLETGGYKGRSRELPKPELHALIAKKLGVPPENIVCEYGMSELSSQAYDRIAGAVGTHKIFHFPLWARARIVSPESGCEVADGERGLLQIFDLANLGSALALQTEDLAVRRSDGFELLGRVAQAEPRGCSRMQVG